MACPLPTPSHSLSRPEDGAIYRPPSPKPFCLILLLNSSVQSCLKWGMETEGTVISPWRRQVTVDWVWTYLLLVCFS